MDIHQYGVGLISSRPFIPGDVVVIHLKGMMRMGFAYVRHCTQRGSRSYTIGLEFKGEPIREAGTWCFQNVTMN